MYKYFTNILKNKSDMYNKVKYPGPCAAFLSGEKIHDKTIEEILNFSDGQLEDEHSYIQYVFPLQEKSMYNPKAPVLTNEEIEWIKSKDGERARISLRIMYSRMMSFYGFEYSASPEKIYLKPSILFDEKSKVWLTPNNHNYKRITRILKCLMLCGMDIYAKEFFNALTKVYEEHKDAIGKTTFDYWKNAIGYSDNSLI